MLANGNTSNRKNYVMTSPGIIEFKNEVRAVLNILRINDLVFIN